MNSLSFMTGEEWDRRNRGEMPKMSIGESIFLAERLMYADGIRTWDRVQALKALFAKLVEDEENIIRGEN